MPKREYYLPKRQLVSQDDGAMIQRPDVPRSRFVGTFSRLTTFGAGRLVPFLIEEILPGDHMRYDVRAYVRMATPLFPLFSQQRIDTHFFFVPNRLVWENWQRFMGEQPFTPTDPIDFTIPQVSVPAAVEAGSIFDYFGLPVEFSATPTDNYSVSALPFRAYNLIYNEWYRDQNLQDAVEVARDDGADSTSFYEVWRRNKSHDYFTSALPWPQKFTAPSVPIGGTAPISGLGWLNADRTALAGPITVLESDSTLSTYDLYRDVGSDPATDESRRLRVRATGTTSLSTPDVFADLSLATGLSINDFRRTFAIQRLLERDARGGTRYTEVLKSHFGVTSPDARMQRPEYIGGGSSTLDVTPVAQTAPDVGSSVGSLGAAVTAVGAHRASFAATEHGYIIGIISVRSELAYQQGIPRMFSRLTRYDFYWPSLAGLGEQAILNKELYFDGDDVRGEQVFGYQERWHEYRQRYSEVTGIFRSQSVVEGTLDAWHLAQNLVDPVLNGTFVQDNPPMDRVLAGGGAAEATQYLADITIQRSAVRPLPTFGTPVGLGRF